MTPSDAPSDAPPAARACFQLTLGDFHLDLSLSVPASRILVLFGSSGSGKTTALRALAGLVRPGAGHISIGDATVYRDGAAHTGLPVWVPPHRRSVGYVTQDHHLFPHLTVAGNIAYGLPARRSAPTRQRVAELLDIFRLQGLGSRRVWQLSGGQRQRAALARAFAVSPRLLLLDEPFASLDMELRRELAAELRSAAFRFAAPVILVTHSREEALALGDTVQVIDRGKTIALGPPLAVLSQPGQGQVARLVGVENLLPMRVTARLPQDGTMICSPASARHTSHRAALPPDTPAAPNPIAHHPHRIETPLADGIAVGDAVTVGIRASDIILAAGPLPQSSARNTWPGVVAQIRLRPPGYQISLDCHGITLHCHITGASLDAMGISPGLPLWAVFKASSCFILSDPPHDDAPSHPV